MLFIFNSFSLKDKFSQICLSATMYIFCYMYDFNMVIICNLNE